MTSPCFLQACRRFVNKNAVTEEAKSSTKTPELVAKYCDSLLRKGNKVCGGFQKRYRAHIRTAVIYARRVLCVMPACRQPLKLASTI
jgi:hypothetical protein